MKPHRVAIIGAGWAGIAAAVQATRLGHHVTLFEATRTPGGRARTLPPLPDLPPLDNGQHILIGAYTDTLALMRTVGVDPNRVLKRLPLTLRQPDGTGITLPDWPAPLANLARLVGIARATGWTWTDKLALLGAAWRWQRMGFRCDESLSVADLYADLPHAVRDRLIDPLCVSALNTPPEQSSAAVFLRVLGDALFGEPGGADLLIPRVDLGQVLPRPALAWLSAHGAQVRLGVRVRQIRRTHAESGWQLITAPDSSHGTQPADPQTDHAAGEAFEHVVLATQPSAAIALLQTVESAMPREFDAWLAHTRALTHTAIATVYALATAPLPTPMLALPSQLHGFMNGHMNGGHPTPAQFVFDRGDAMWPSPSDSAAAVPAAAQAAAQSDPLPHRASRLFAFVASTSQGSADELTAQVIAQAQAQLPAHGPYCALRTVVEKRATFACVPGLRRPSHRIAPGLWACGDYVEGPYPATLEGAVRSGLAVAQAIG